MTTPQHIPVMLAQCLDGLSIKPNGCYVDATLGRGGHSAAILDRLTTGRLIAIDRDADAIAYARQQLPKLTALRGNFAELTELLETIGVTAIDGILYDFGISSPQIDTAERGFSYMHDARLDMRMDQSQPLTAYDIVNTWSREQIKRILHDYGEERYADSIARAIERARTEAPIETTLQLVEIIKNAMPRKGRGEAQHPAMRTFQGLRIAVNDELDALRDSLTQAITLLKPGGRLVCISFHSLEERIVKSLITEESRTCVCPPKMPICTCDHTPRLKRITKKPLTADEIETQVNPRARSAKLRIAERL